MEVGALLSAAKGSSAVTVRDLAARAGVAGSTITRIQAGAVDPTVDTMRRVLRSAGYDLELNAARIDRPHVPRLADVVHAWRGVGVAIRLDWPRWRGLLDELAREPAYVPEAIYPPPPPAGDAVVDALVAAVAEKLADDASIPRPSWTRSVPALEVPYRPPVVRAGTSQAIAPQLETRGLLIDTASLWRDPVTIGV